MGLHSVVSVLALAAVAFASVNDNTLGGGERVVLVAPVLAPPRESRTHVTDRARQFPILVLLAQQNPQPQPKALNVNPQPIYVQKLEDQDRPARLNRQKRHLTHKSGFSHFGGGYRGGYGGGNGGGYGGGGDYHHGGGY